MKEANLSVQLHADGFIHLGIYSGVEGITQVHEAIMGIKLMIIFMVYLFLLA